MNHPLSKPIRRPEYAQFIEHSVLKPDTTQQVIQHFCEEARQYGFAAVAITPTHVKYAKSLLQGSGVMVDAAIGFPLGTSTTAVKVAETVDAIENGADEIDMVINIGALKDGQYDYVRQEMQAVADTAHRSGIKAKAILETYLLTDPEKEKCCQLAVEAGMDYVKTCTGFNGGSATVHDIQLMKNAVAGKCLIKASTGIDDRETFEALKAAGAVRFGTSKGIKIVEGTP